MSVVNVISVNAISDWYTVIKVDAYQGIRALWFTCF